MASIIDTIRNMILGPEDDYEGEVSSSSEDYLYSEGESDESESGSYQKPHVADIRTYRGTNKQKSASNVISINGNDLRTHIVQHKPTKFDDVSKYREILFDKKLLMLNLEGVDHVLAQRIMDFVGGMCYALEGEIERVGNIYIVMHRDCDLSALGASEDYAYKGTIKAFGTKANAR